MRQLITPIEILGQTATQVEAKAYIAEDGVLNCDLHDGDGKLVYQDAAFVIGDLPFDITPEEIDAINNPPAPIEES